jgi:MFS family permease
MLSVIAAQFGNTTSSAWYLSSFTLGKAAQNKNPYPALLTNTGCALGFLLSGTHSDLFGRRIIVLIGNFVSALGSILCATSHNYHQFIAGMAIMGFASGMSQLGLIGVPELLPNKWRHIGIVISDAVLFPILVCAPIIGRYAVKDPTSRNWTYVYYGSFIAMVLTFVAVYFLYIPPKHPRGVPWKVALRGLDYVGGLLVTGGVLLTLMGIVYTTYQPAKSAIVLGPLCSGIFLLILFGIWENVSSVPYKLCPPEIFSHHWGRSFTVPFMFGAIITMYYYAANIIWPVSLDVPSLLKQAVDNAQTDYDIGLLHHARITHQGLSHSYASQQLGSRWWSFLICRHWASCQALEADPHYLIRPIRHLRQLDGTGYAVQ